MKTSKLILIFIVFSFEIGLYAQPNCAAYSEQSCKAACELAWEADKFPQGSKESQELFDKSIELCPNFAYALYEKSVPYLKQGLFKEWKELADKAVAIEPETYLLNRGWCQFSFLKNYNAALADLNQLYKIRNTFELGYSGSGEYSIQLVRAICYQKTGNINKGIEIMEELTNSKTYSQGLFDYFHIGNAYLEANLLSKAKTAFDIQNKENELAETYYYYAKIFQREANYEMEEKMLLKAKKLYDEGKIMQNNYYHYVDKIFKTDIDKALKKMKTR